MISSGILISLLVTHRYSRSLFDSLSSQVEYLGRSVALQVADTVLINDLVALQNTLDHQSHGNPSLAYLFIVKDEHVLAHTFRGGVPVDLLNANKPLSAEQSHLQQIASTKGQYYLDVAVPIFEGKAGTLRLGYSEKPYREEVAKLRMRMALFTLAILLLALAGSLFFVRRITGPLAKLAGAANSVDRGEPHVSVEVEGKDEVAVLATAFNHMVSSLQTYTTRLEEQATELERAHHQTRTFCGIVQEIGALQTLQEMGAYLIKKFNPILECSRMAFVMINDTHDALFIVTERQAIELKESGPVQTFSSILDGLQEQEKPCATGCSGLMASLTSEILQFEAPRATIPLVHDKRTFGVLMVAGAEECRCGAEEIKVVRLMLAQAAGVIRRAVLHEEEIRELQSRITAPMEFRGIVSKNHKMQTIFRLIEDIAPTDATVLIQGESGTGKELVARAVHQQSPRKDKPFIVIDCSAYPATLLESELFGHEKGSFTGAIRQKAGRFEQADGGTVFLDEIGEIPLPAQIKLLRVLQTHRFERLGGEQTLSVDVRVIAATNRNLLDEVKDGRFREDLYYRINVIGIHLPPLRQRRDDIPLLARHFLNRIAGGQGKKVERFSPDAMRLLLDHPWAGNVRELENTIEHAAVLAKGERIEPVHFPSTLQKAPLPSRSSGPPTMLEHEAKLLHETMEVCGWNKKEAARRLGISRSTLYEKLKKYRIAKPAAH